MVAEGDKGFRDCPLSRALVSLRLRNLPTIPNIVTVRQQRRVRETFRGTVDSAPGGIGPSCGDQAFELRLNIEQCLNFWGVQHSLAVIGQRAKVILLTSPHVTSPRTVVTD